MLVGVIVYAFVFKLVPPVKSVKKVAVPVNGALGPLNELITKVAVPVLSSVNKRKYKVSPAFTAMVCEPF